MNKMKLTDKVNIGINPIILIRLIFVRCCKQNHVCMYVKSTYLNCNFNDTVPFTCTDQIIFFCLLKISPNILKIEGGLHILTRSISCDNVLSPFWKENFNIGKITHMSSFRESKSRIKGSLFAPICFTV